MTHNELWTAIINVANWRHVSCSGLARMAGLDSTTFNKSKRFNKYGQPHCPSTYTLACVLDATGLTLAEFAKFLPHDKPNR